MTSKTDLRGYIQDVIFQAGSDAAVGQYLGFGDGSRVGLWRRGRGRPSELACVKLARWTGDDPLHVLRLAGYTELAGLLAGLVVPMPVQQHPLRKQMEALRALIDLTLED